MRRNTRGRRKSPARLGFAVEAAGAEETDGLVFSRLILETHKAPTATRAARRPTGGGLMPAQSRVLKDKTVCRLDSAGNQASHQICTRFGVKSTVGFLTFTGV